MHRYRPDIDGLRAIAVLPVVLFHAEIPGFSGGFVGVDIFFVISGYLITSIIVNDIWSRKFSILSFYERRIRRIFPAFFVMIAILTVVGALFLIPSELKDLGSSTFAATLFLSNMLFWYKSGYFDAPSELNPLLHTWSLGVEEQFYLGFPLFLWLWLRTAGTKKMWLGILLLAIFSLGLSAYTVIWWKRATFFFIATRAWELLFGSLLAVLPNAAIERPALRDMLSVAGLLLIAWSVFTFSQSTSFPGLNALFPSVGAVLIILTGMRGQSLVGRMLSNRAFVFVGLISYSLYLWHWPFIVFSKYYALRPLSGSERVAIIVISFLVATLSWRFVETPFRKSHNIWLTQRIFICAGAAMMVSIAIGTVFYLGNGLPQRLSPRAQLLAAGSTDVGEYSKGCLSGPTAEEIEEQRLCKLGDPDATPSFLLWGDSHAAAMADGIDLEAKKYGQSGYYIGMYSCPPLIGIDGWDEKDLSQHERCRTINNSVPALVKAANIKNVILFASWSRLATEYGSQRIADDSTLKGDRRRDYYIDRRFRATLDMLKKLGVSVFIITDTPSPLYDVPSTLARFALIARNVDIRLSVADYIRMNQFPSKLFEQIGGIYGVDLIRPERELCDSEKCAVQKAGRPLYSSSGHISRSGAQGLAPIFAPIFERHDNS